jgi:hypothetical protein
MAPELQILAINAGALAVGYSLIYPALGPLTNTRATKLRIAKADAGVGALALLTAALLFWDSGIGFSLFLFETNWFWFALLTLIGLEVPLALWFFRRHGLSLDGDDGP